MLINKRIRSNKAEEKDSRPQAVALGYDADKDDAPRVLASGQGLVAQRIMDRARELDLPIQEDALLVEALATVDVGDHIPPELYRVVAELLAFLYRVQKKRGQT
ncbi:MAG: hypothetical protein DWQ07_05205 [Chloroflexi bacterium]|nr:MAG: hypothetical protein DWQ07_05205 [Chloroflexota bacterium]MBL1194831.1 EscU/YscU/HrcU family type III secretion system export apparatus switch protein [Chloroflexota bacterium]NOH12122.1 EscU/YscU/HrcU family type III secretion system export apparatus switch protein [Chloroflexota bacterium]